MGFNIPQDECEVANNFHGTVTNRIRSIYHVERALYRSSLHSHIIIRILCTDVKAHSLPQHALAEHIVNIAIGRIHDVN